MKIPFADFRPMHNEIRDKLDDAYRRVMDSSWFIKGEECCRFEKMYAEYCDTKYCIGVGNGLDALHIILMAMGIGKGDEVIVPSNTYIATALAVSYSGAVPVFAEPDIDTYNINAENAEKCITSKTKAIIAVHLQGRAADMDAVRAVADKYGLKVIEDSAQAHGTRYKGKRTGSLSDAAAFSFYPGKNLGALGDGGCITTNNRDIAEKAYAIGNYGSDRKYHHIYQGVNSRLDEMQAAFLSEKLPFLDKWNNERKKIAERYFNEITNPQIILPLKSNAEFEHTYHVFAVRCSKRDELEKYLNKNGISTVKHYPIPIYMQKAYECLHIPKGTFPIAEKISKTILSIPMYYGMTDDKISYVIEKINSFC